MSRPRDLGSLQGMPDRRLGNTDPLQFDWRNEAAGGSIRRGGPFPTMRALFDFSLTSGVVLFLGVAAVAPAQEAQTAEEGESSPLALDGLDPVLLFEHREVEGDPLLAVEHDGLLYRFDSDRTRRAFVEDPERYAVQLGGACARMGPGVAGEPELFAVHPTGIYLFGTEQCLEAFLEHPGRYVLPPLPRLEPSNAEKRQARELLELAAGALGKKPIRRLPGYRIVGVEERGARATPFELWLSLDGAVRRKRLVGEEAIVETWDGERGSLSGRTAPEPLRAWARRELLEEAAELDALTALRALDLDHVVARVEAREEPGPTRWVRLEVPDGWGRAAHRARRADSSEQEAPEQIGLEIDRHSGRVVAMRFRGRGPGGRAGWITRRFEDFRAIGDLYLPFRREDTLEGGDEPFRVVTLERIAVERLDPELLEISSEDR